MKWFRPLQIIKMAPRGDYDLYLLVGEPRKRQIVGCAFKLSMTEKYAAPDATMLFGDKLVAAMNITEVRLHTGWSLPEGSSWEAFLPDDEMES
jgi:hypothetical protein